MKYIRIFITWEQRRGRERPEFGATGYIVEQRRRNRPRFLLKKCTSEAAPYRPGEDGRQKASGEEEVVSVPVGLEGDVSDEGELVAVLKCSWKERPP